MLIYNQDKTKQLNQNTLDFTKGKLIPDTIIHHIPEIKEQQEVRELELIRTSEITGGREFREIIVQPYIAPVEEHDEIEEILVYILN